MKRSLVHSKSRGYQRFLARRSDLFGLEDYRYLDQSLSELLLSVHDFDHFYLGRRNPTLQKYFSFMDEMFWQPSRRDFLLAHLGKSGKIHTGALFHESVHRLFDQRFGRRAVTDPVLCLLGESTASCVDIHFGLLLAANTKWSPRQFFKHLSLKSVHDRDLSPLQKQLSHLRRGKSPMILFHRYQLDFMRFYSEMHDAFQRQIKSGSTRMTTLERVIQKSENPWILNCFDFVTNLYFANAYRRRPYSRLRHQRLLERAFRKAQTDGQVSTYIQGLLDA